MQDRWSILCQIQMFARLHTFWKQNYRYCFSHASGAEYCHTSPLPWTLFVGLSVPDDLHGSGPWMSCCDNGDFWVAVPSKQAAAHGGPEALCNCGFVRPIEGKKIHFKQWLLAMRCSPWLVVGKSTRVCRSLS